MRAIHQGFGCFCGGVAMANRLGDGDHLGLEDPRRFFGSVSAGTLSEGGKA
jgi:hypothetical protein